MAFKMTNPPYPKHGHTPYNLTKAQSDTFDTNKDGEITGSDFPLKKKNAQGKEQGIDGRACWEGFRYAGTEDGEDKCVPIGKK